MQRPQPGGQLGQLLDLDRGAFFAAAAQLGQVRGLLPDRLRVLVAQVALAAQPAFSEEAALVLGLARLWLHPPERV